MFQLNDFLLVLVLVLLLLFLELAHFETFFDLFGKLLIYDSVYDKFMREI